MTLHSLLSISISFSQQDCRVAPSALWGWGGLLLALDYPLYLPQLLLMSYVTAQQALAGGTCVALYSPLQEHRLQQEAPGRRAGRTLSPHVLLHIASQVLGKGQTYPMTPGGIR